MSSIFNIQQDKAELEYKLEDLMLESEGEITEEIQEILDQLSITEEGFLDKVDSTTAFINKTKSDVDAIAQEVKRLQRLKKVKENAIDRNKNNIVAAMLQFGFEKGLDRGTYKLSIRKSTPAPEIFGEIPKEFINMEMVEKVDNAAVKEFLKENGPTDWGRPITKQNLTIR